MTNVYISQKGLPASRMYASNIPQKRKKIDSVQNLAALLKIVQVPKMRQNASIQMKCTCAAPSGTPTESYQILNGNQIGHP